MSGSSSVGEKRKYNGKDHSSRIPADVTLVVGEDKVEVEGYSQMLAFSSEYFASMFCGDWAENSEKKRIELPDQHPEAIKMLIDLTSPGSSVEITPRSMQILLPVLCRFSVVERFLKPFDERLGTYIDWAAWGSEPE